MNDDRDQLDQLDADADSWRARRALAKMRRRELAGDTRPDLTARTLQRLSARLAALPAIKDLRDRQSALYVLLAALLAVLLLLGVAYLLRTARGVTVAASPV